MAKVNWHYFEDSKDFIMETLQNEAGYQTSFEKLSQVKCKGITRPLAHHFDNIEWYPTQEVLESTTNVNSGS